MIAVCSENLIPLSEAPAQMPRRGGKRISIPTLYRWSLHGVRGVRLETVQLGGTRYTSVEAIARFSETLTAARDGQPAADRAPAAVGRRRAATAAKLDQIGI